MKSDKKNIETGPILVDPRFGPTTCHLLVRAQPGSKRDEIRGLQDGALKVCVTQAPEKGKANKAIRKVLADVLDLKVSQIELLSGETASQKKFQITGIDPAILQSRLDALAES